MAAIIFAGACVQHHANVHSAPATVPAATAITPPVYVPSLTNVSGPMPDGILAWDAISKETNVAADAEQAHFTFYFTNVSVNPLVILNVHPSCGCTTAKLPPLPWTLEPGTNGSMDVTVSVEGKSGKLFKTVMVYTDKGSKMLLLTINFLPPAVPAMTEADRARGLAVSKVDRQAVFHGDCATCHVKPGNGKYGKPLYDAVCAICHEGEHRATMVPDLHNLKTPTNIAFWRTWIAHGKAGSLMPAFSTADGGPLNDMQIASLAAYLNAAIPSSVPEKTE
ncbi:MAG TPA: DUF1573 domain-containing protein [Verrucomicrobiae bacterium]|nr:DUF1573 domain-containing protein [Verrucomicrobiae bacterium]